MHGCVVRHTVQYLLYVRTVSHSVTLFVPARLGLCLTCFGTVQKMMLLLLTLNALPQELAPLQLLLSLELTLASHCGPRLPPLAVRGICGQVPGDLDPTAGLAGLFWSCCQNHNCAGDSIGTT